MRHYGLFLGEFGVGLVGVKCCSHTLLLHAWVSVRRARAHPETVTAAAPQSQRADTDGCLARGTHTVPMRPLCVLREPLSNLA